MISLQIPLVIKEDRFCTYNHKKIYIYNMCLQKFIFYKYDLYNMTLCVIYKNV